MRGASTGIVYGGLKYQVATTARCIADVKADVDHTSFLAGTLSLKEENEVHLIRLSPSGSELICDGLFYHPNEIWDLKTCPFDPRIFSTVFTSGEAYGASVWKIPELYGQSNAPQLEQLVSLDKHSFKIKCVLWWPSGKHDRLISIDEGNLFLWSIDSSNKVAKVSSLKNLLLSLERLMVVLLADCKILNLFSFGLQKHQAINKIKDLAVSIEGKSHEEKKSLLAKCAATTLSSKLIGGEKEFFANMVMEAILAIGNDDRLNLIGIICVAVHLISMRDEFTNLKYSRVEIDKVRFEWAECMLDYI
ncbi:hypothetical protein ZIOFF_031832 [Zingiber officinale]|uniref:EIPR1-like beta-propeller domain-containing protein n=1 Tax=Zingiber officinale TaxID=94328 RepID=A0A8J5GML5_ZINOF|nr:hypothetical protein ZIOFF_031832 [Zingiber officinale]